MNDVVYKTLKEKDFIVKNFIFKVAIELNLSLNETILLIYFFNQEVPTLNIPLITKTTSLSEEAIMSSFTRLIGINLITVSVEANDDGKKCEVINLDNIVKSVTTDITREHKSTMKSNLFEVFEKEFGRPLSAMEYELINNWTSEGISEDLILEALREAVYNGVRGSLRYISKILQSWKEKGYTNKNDIRQGLKNESENNVLTDLFDYNWLDEE